MTSPTLEDLTRQIVAFRDARDWKQFHNPKDLALSLNLEAAEVLELMQWRNGSDLDQHLAQHRDDVGAELSDVLWWVLLLAHELEIDLGSAFEAKLRENGMKYPVDRARGSARKYTES